MEHVSEIVNGFSIYLRTKKNPARSAAEIVESLKDDFSRCNADLMVTKAKLAGSTLPFPEQIKNKEIELARKDSQLKNKENELNSRELQLINNETLKGITSATQAISAREIALKKMIEEKTIGFPWIAEKYAEYVIFLGKQDEKYLKNKKPPATKAANKIKEHSLKAANAERRARIAEGQLAFYESVIPWIVELKSAPDDAITRSDAKNTETDIDPARKYILDGEWTSLSTAEKFQKSLDRYWKRHKSNWEIGRDFERFIGYQYEERGWEVIYFGAIKGFEDLGRDIIAKKNNEVHIVQCKYWAADKIIHEKHLFQLFGTSVVYKIENIINTCLNAIFITSCSLSDTAKSVATALGIKVIEKQRMIKFPCIKCNIGHNREKIYHLPFDQQYDRIKIDKRQGEFYCATIEEAEKAGFRRAFRWKGN